MDLKRRLMASMKKKKKRNVLLKAEKNECAYMHNQLDVRWSSNRKEAAIERDGI